MSTNQLFSRFLRCLIRRIFPTGVMIFALLIGTSQISYAIQPSSPSGPSEGGCVNPSPLSSLSKSNYISPIAPTDWYATGVVGSIDVISPENVLGVENHVLATLTDTSVLTISFSSYFTSGIGVVLIHPAESTCEYLWLYIRHYSNLAQPPLVVSEDYTGIGIAESGISGDGYSVSMVPHRYVVITTNTLLKIDAVYFLEPAKRYWLPVMMRNAGF